MERSNRSDGVNFKAPERFRHSAVVVEGDKSIVPLARDNQIILVNLAPFKDHGRPAFVGSTIGNNDALTQVASDLGRDEGQRLNDALIRTMEGYLNNSSVRSDGIMKSDKEGRPDIHVLNVGNSFQDSGLRLYFHLGEFEGAPVIIQDARTTVKNSERVERVLRREGGYHPPKGWENSKKNKGRSH